MKSFMWRNIPCLLFSLWFIFLTMFYPMSPFYRIISGVVILVCLLQSYLHFRVKYTLYFQNGNFYIYRKKPGRINHILTLINEEHSLEVVLRHIVNEAFRLVPGAETYSFVIYNPHKGMYEFKEVKSKVAEFFDDISLTPEEVLAVFDGKPGPFIDNQVQQSNLRFREGVRSKFNYYGAPEAILFIPIWVDKQLQGYITLDNWTRGDAFGQKDLKQIEYILPQLVLAFSEAQRKFQLTEYKTKLEQLYSVGQRLTTINEPEELIQEVLKIIRNTLEYNDICIFLVQDDRLIFKGGYKGDGTYKTHAPDLNLEEGICGLVVRTGEPQIIPDVSQNPLYVCRREDIASELAIPIRAGKEVLGVLNLESSRLNNYKREDKELMMTVASQLGIALSNLRNQNDLKKALLQIITALARSIETKDNITGGHCERMEHYALMVGSLLNLTAQQMENLRRATRLHDIGKIGIPGNILEKTGKLTSDEFEIMQEHPTFGAKILKEVEFLVDVANIIEQHHERVDGLGYPFGLKGEEISIEARIIAVVDAFDAMTSNRPYRKAMSEEEAVQELQKHSGTQFDKQVVDIFIRLLTQDITRQSVADIRRVIS